MADVNANIGVNIDTSAALAQLKALQRQISQFHTSIARSSESAALAQRSLQKNLIGSINSIGAFSAELRTVKTSAESFTNSLEKNKFGLREYFRYAGASTKTFGKLFKSEFNTIGRVAEERVKTLQTQYIKMGRNASGAMEAIAVRPTSLNMQDYGTRTAIAAQKQALFNQLMKQGSTNLLNFGKNTQWAGRQLMVGFTIPLTIVGSAATKTFMEMEVQALKFKKVYGDLFTPRAETQQALDNIVELGKQFTKYGISVSQTVGLSAQAAAAGFKGLDLQRQTNEATRLSILGQVDSQKALETTISLQNAFGMSSDKLADSINFLNAVENQTVVSLDDITTAIPKVAPVIQQLGGDVKDLTFFIAAMKEGGINAAEGANALKSGLAALINPTKKASEMLAQFGINAKEIVVKNKGNLKATVVEFATALNQLDPLNRAQAIEQMFGKFQFARLSTLFANVAKDGNQASRVLELANSSVEQLSALSERELGMTAASSMNKFKKSVEDLKFALIPVGEAFLEAATPIIEFVGSVLEKFGNLSDGTKKLITFLTVGVGAIGPIFLMTFGLIANALANGLKGVMILRHGYLRLTGQSQILGEQTQYLNTEQLEAAAAAHSLDQSHAKLTQRFSAETVELNKLVAAYQSATRAAQSFAFNNPGMMMPPRGGRKFASGIVSVPGPKGAGDIFPAMLSPGEAVIPAKFVEKYGPLIQGMIANNIPGYMAGKDIAYTHAAMPFAPGSAQFQQGIKIAGLESLAAQFPQFIKVVSNLVAELPQSLNVAMKKGVGVGEFSKEYQARTGKFGTAAKLGGLDISSPETAMALQKLENEIGETTIALAKQQAAGGQVVVSDELFAKATRSVIDKYKTVEGSAGRAAQALDNASKQIGQVRVSAKKEDIVSGLKSGQFRKTRTGNQTQNQIMFGNTNVGRESVSSPGQFHSGNPISPRGTYRGKLKRSISVNPSNIVNGVDFDKLRAQVAGTGGGANMVAGIRARQQRQYNKEDDAILGAMGIKSARSAITATEREAQTASPSRRTRKIGQDIARGLEVGMADRQGNVALAGSNLSNAAVGGSRGGVPSIPFSGAVAASLPKNSSINLAEVTANARTNREKLKTLQESKNLKIVNQTNDRFAGLNSKIMGGTFALTSLAGVASMAGGNLGKLSGMVFQLSGVVFALSTVLQILPSRFKKLLSSVGGIKLAIFAIAITGLIAGVNLYKKSQEEARRKLISFGDSLKTTQKQLESTGEYFGVARKKSTLETPGGVVEKTRASNSLRNKINEFKQSDVFEKDYKNTVKSLREQTNADAKTALLIRAQTLLAQGYSEEQINIIISSLQEAAGKQDLNLLFKNIKVESLNKDILEGLKPRLAELDLVKNKFKEISKYQAIGNDRKTAKLVLSKEIVATEEFQGKLTNAGMAVQEFIKNIDILREQGGMSVKDVEKSFNGLMYTIKTMAPNLATRGLLIKEAFKGLDSDIAKAAAAIEIAEKQTLLLEAAMYGAIIPVAMLNAYTQGTGSGLYSEGELQGDIERLIKFAKQVTDKKYKDTQNKFKNLDDGEKGKPDERLSIIQNYFSAKEALIKQERQLDEDALQAKLDNTEKLIKAEEKEIEAGQRKIDLLSRRIEFEYDRPIQALQDESTILGNNLTLIREQEDATNKQYDTQIKSLEKISSINQEIASQEKSRLTIADALTSGDIAAAAAAVQDARAQAAASRIDQQTKALEASRQQALAGITVGGVTKDQIEARTFEIGQQTFLLEQQRKILQNEVVVLQDKNYETEQSIYKIKKDSLIPQQEALDKYKNGTIALIESQLVLGQTQKEWVTAEGKVNLYNAALDLSNEKLRSMNKFLASIAIKSADLQTTLQGKGTIGVASNAVSRSSDYDAIEAQLRAAAAAAAARRAKMYGGKIFPMAMGGMIPKYMVSGGGIGSDTVPAMLTPGEFVMNKRATKSFGPLLSMLNESKYPSMIGSSYDGQGSAGSVTSVNNNSSNVYNYSVGISVPQSNANPNDIARAVIGQIKYIDNQRIRGQR